MEALPVQTLQISETADPPIGRFSRNVISLAKLCRVVIASQYVGDEFSELVNLTVKS